MNPKILPLLNDIMGETGCLPNEAVYVATRAFLHAGKTREEAYDMIFGEGERQNIEDQVRAAMSPFMTGSAY